jgi:hypothetical protein
LLAVRITPDSPQPLPAMVQVQRSSLDGALRWDDLYWSGTYGGFCAEDGRAAIDAGDGTLVDRGWTGIMLPYWAMMVLAAAGPVGIALRSARARLRASRGECGRCGYVMVGDVCPACAARGAVIGITPRTHLVRIA